jgi:hypothetical protein
MKTNNNPMMLCSCIREKYFHVLEFCEYNGISIKTLETIRTLELQEHYFSIGASATLNSMHLPQPPNQLALAFDIAPVEYLDMRYWNPGGKLWYKIAEFSKSIGLEPGVYWEHFHDSPHHQLRKCQCTLEASK